MPDNRYEDEIEELLRRLGFTGSASGGKQKAINKIREIAERLQRLSVDRMAMITIWLFVGAVLLRVFAPLLLGRPVMFIAVGLAILAALVAFFMPSRRHSSRS